MRKIKMTEQDLNIGKSLFSLFEVSSSEAKLIFFEEFALKNQKELEELTFYLMCKQAHDKGDWVTEEELFKTLNERV